MLAFAAAALALPTTTTGALLVCGVIFFSYAAVNDERSIEQSSLAADYASYKMRVGRFLPRQWRRGGGRALGKPTPNNRWTGP
jgi:protein-S-isoprenylcysteine O-methyltransferase Ste14